MDKQWINIEYSPNDNLQDNIRSSLPATVKSRQKLRPGHSFVHPCRVPFQDRICGLLHPTSTIEGRWGMTEDSRMVCGLMREFESLEFAMLTRDFSKAPTAECQENKTNNVDEMRRLAGTLLGLGSLRGWLTNATSSRVVLQDQFFQRIEDQVLGQ